MKKLIKIKYRINENFDPNKRLPQGFEMNPEDRNKLKIAKAEREKTVAMQERRVKYVLSIINKLSDEEKQLLKRKLR